jgi:hypothetical protein
MQMRHIERHHGRLIVLSLALIGGGVELERIENE